MREEQEVMETRDGRLQGCGGEKVRGTEKDSRDGVRKVWGQRAT